MNELLAMMMNLEYKGKESRLWTYSPGIWPEEPNVSDAFRRLTRDSMPNIYFLTGHFERSPFKVAEREYGLHAIYDNSRTSLISVGFKIDTISLLNRNIDANAGILVVADPRSALHPVEQEKILQFISDGGNFGVS